jgi:hypothetical protein
MARARTQQRWRHYSNSCKRTRGKSPSSTLLAGLGTLKLLSQETHHDIIATRGDEALAHSTVTKCLRKAQSDAATVPSNRDASSFHLDDSDRAILTALEGKPFSLVRELP